MPRSAVGPLCCATNSGGSSLVLLLLVLAKCQLRTQIWVSVSSLVVPPRKSRAV